MRKGSPISGSSTFALFATLASPSRFSLLSSVSQQTLREREDDVKRRALISLAYLSPLLRSRPPIGLEFLRQSSARAAENVLSRFSLRSIAVLSLSVLSLSRSVLCRSLSGASQSAW